MGNQQLNIEELFQRYPHIARKVTATWGTHACRDFLNSLLVNERAEIRAGFTQNDAKLIFGLLSKHDDLFPLQNTNHFDPPPFQCSTAKHRVYQKPKNDLSFLKWFFLFFVALISYAVYSFVKF